jgi:hypothetical protein
MAINYFIGWSVQELEAELRLAQEDLAAGKSITNSGAGDASMASRIDKSSEARIEMILKALHRLCPEKYPATEIARLTETKAAFL